MSSSHAEELEGVLRRPNSSSNGDLKPALTRLWARIKSRSEKSTVESYAFFEDSLAVLSKIKGGAHSELRLNCLLEIGQFCSRYGYSADAISAVRLLRELAARVSDKNWTRKANIIAGVVHGEIGDIAESVTRYTDALVVGLDLGDFSEVYALIGLSATFNYGGLYHEARRCATHAVAILEQTQSRPLARAYAYTNMAQSYQYLDDYRNGFEAIQMALALSESVRDARSAFNHCIREFTFVQLALELGRFVEAREHAALCRKHSLWGGNPRSKVLADIVAGLCEIHAGDVTLGFKHLESALSNSTDFALRIDSLTALVKAYDKVGDPEQALTHVRQLLAAVRAAREESIAAIMSVRANSANTAFLPNPDDMRGLELREAKLEAQMAKRELFHSRMEMLERLAIAADLKEEDSGEHGYRVGRLSAFLAADLGWEPEACTALDMAARLHDIGKIGVPDRILFKSQKLKDAEREFIATHTMIGSEMLAKSDIPHLRIAQEIALHHHEWWNGEGYPSKLKGKRIPLHARIVALADVFDALTHGRPYAAPWPMEEAIAEIRRRRSTQFDPELTDRFIALVERLIREQPDLDDYLGKAGRNSPFLQARRKIHRLLAEKHENEAKTPLKDSEIHV